MKNKKTAVPSQKQPLGLVVNIIAYIGIFSLLIPVFLQLPITALHLAAVIIFMLFALIIDITKIKWTANIADLVSLAPILGLGLSAWLAVYFIKMLEL